VKRRAPDSADLTLIAGGVVAFLLLCVWLATALGGLATDGTVKTIDLGGVLRAAARVVQAPLSSDPAVAGGPPVWVVCLGTVLLAALPPMLLATRSSRRRHHARRLWDAVTGSSGRGARWARTAELRPLLTDTGATGRLRLGRAAGRVVATEQHHSVIVFGPTGSYKTSGLAVPAIRDWDGTVLCASVKADLLRDTFEQRERRGDVMVFDPTAATGMPSDGWSPLVGCANWHGALRVAQWLCSATHTGGTGGDLDFWYRAAKKLLAPMLFAAASSGRSMADVVRWVDHQTADEVESLLGAAACEEAADAWTARDLRDPKQRSSIYTTLETVLDAYQDPRVLRDAERSAIAPTRLLDGGRSALYLCSPADDQDALRPVFSTLILSITTAVYAHAASTGRPLDPPLLLVLDELANVAPVPRLEVLASTGRDQGIQQLSILQDFSQLEERYGPRRARTIVNNHHAKLVLSGQSDQATLDLVGQLLGDEEIDQHSVAVADGRTTRTTSSHFRRLAPPDAARQQAGGGGILIYGNLPPARIELSPWFRPTARSARSRAPRPSTVQL